MADVREMRIFTADQIEVQEDLPSILKGYSKEVIRHSPEDIIQFSRQYFEELLKAEGYFKKEEKKAEKPAASDKSAVDAKSTASQPKKEEAKSDDHPKDTKH